MHRVKREKKKKKCVSIFFKYVNYTLPSALISQQQPFIYSATSAKSGSQNITFRFRFEP
jgi:hypothetical protein